MEVQERGGEGDKYKMRTPKWEKLRVGGET